MEAKINLFVLDKDPVKAAQLQCDKHIVKMVVESAQMLSTAHRILDGVEEMRPSKSGKRMVKYWRHRNSNLENVLYRVAHQNHPCTIWTMRSNNNYNWHYVHFVALCEEYKYRYGKTHLTDTKLREVLSTPPTNIDVGYLTQQPLAMKSNPECMFEDVVKSYRAYYQTKQDRFKMVWTKREIPEWFKVKKETA
jgi:hypothetical protein